MVKLRHKSFVIQSLITMTILLITGLREHYNFVKIRLTEEDGLQDGHPAEQVNLSCATQ